jgi:hypothetical protein
VEGYPQARDDWQQAGDDRQQAQHQLGQADSIFVLPTFAKRQEADDQEVRRAVSAGTRRRDVRASATGQAQHLLRLPAVAGGGPPGPAIRRPERRVGRLSAPDAGTASDSCQDGIAGK